MPTFNDVTIGSRAYPSSWSASSSALRQAAPQSPMMPRVFDCFTFHNEFDLLRLRTSLLHSHVDNFIVAEATVTFSGSSRTLQLGEPLLSELSDKVVVVTVDDMPLGQNAWERESHQRRSLLRGLQRVGAKPGDIVMLSDADEIPDPRMVASLDRQLGREPVELTMRYMQYKLNLEVARPWPLARAVRMSPDIDLQRVRERTDLAAIADAGWHFTYLGSAPRLRTKINDFAHQELVGVHDSKTHLQRCLRLQVDVLGRYPMGVVARTELPREVAQHFAHRSDLWASELSVAHRALSRLYRLTTQQRARLGQGFCDDHPVAAAILAVTGATGRRARSAIRSVLS